MTCYYALIYRARGPYEEIFVLTFKSYGLNSHLTSLQCACKLKSFFEKFLFSYQFRAVSFRAILCLACQTVLRPRSRLVDFNKFYYNLKVTRGRHEFQHENTGTRAQRQRNSKLPVASCQLSVASYQLISVSCQLVSVSCYFASDKYFVYCWPNSHVLRLMPEKE